MSASTGKKNSPAHFMSTARPVENSSARTHALSWKRALIADTHQRSGPWSILLAVHVAPALRAPKLKKTRGLNIASNTPVAAQPSCRIIYIRVRRLYSEGWAQAHRKFIKSHISSNVGDSSRRSRYRSAGAGTRRTEQLQRRRTPNVSDWQSPRQFLERLEAIFTT